MALLMPMFTVSASAASTKWNGTSALKAGKSYVISSAVTMDSKFTIPAKTTLTVATGGSLTVSKGVTATVKGTLSVTKGGALKVNAGQQHLLVCCTNFALKSLKIQLFKVQTI